MSEPFAETVVRSGATPPMHYVSTPPYLLYTMDLRSMVVLRYIVHPTLAEAVADLVRFNLPFIPWRAAAVFDAEYQSILEYGATDMLELHGTDEAFVELAKHRPDDEVALWQAQATLATTLPVAEEQAWSPST